MNGSDYKLNQVCKTTEPWDDVSAKVVGRFEDAAARVSQVDVGAVYRKSWPKGVFRFRSFEESDQWLIDNVKFYRR